MIGLGPLRKVCQVEEYQTSSHRLDAWSVELGLECGHAIYRKRSDYRGGRVHCRMCGDQVLSARCRIR